MFDGHYVDGNMRNIPDHFHAHARPEGGFFGHGFRDGRAARGTGRRPGEPAAGEDPGRRRAAGGRRPSRWARSPGPRARRSRSSTCSTPSGGQPFFDELVERFYRGVADGPAAACTRRT